jgi:hypothetical protein
MIVERLRMHDWYFVPHAPHVPVLRAEGVNAIELPLWFEPEWFRPLATAEEHDLLFVGDLDNPLNHKRRELMSRLGRKYRLTVVTAGTAPEGARRLPPTTNPHALNRLLNRAKLVVGSDHLDDTSGLNQFAGQYLYYTDEYFVRQRTFLALGAGRCYLVESHPLAERLFEAEREIVLWRDACALEESIGLLLEDEARRRAIGAAGARRAHAEHTTAHRLQTLFEHFGVAEC